MGTDRRRTRRKDQRRLLWIVIGFLVVAGAAAIALVYGLPAAGLGLVCLLAGGAVVLLLWAILALMGRWASEDG
jgi:hypothetical protein